MKPLLNVITVNPSRYEAERIVCETDGKKLPDTRTSYYFVHRETKREYAGVVFAVAPPGFEMPGFGLVLGYDRSLNSRNTRFIHVIDEFECNKRGLEPIVKEMDHVSRKYGLTYSKNWYIEANNNIIQRLTELVIDQKLRFYFNGGPYFGMNGSVREYLKTLAEYTSIIERGSCVKLKTYTDFGPSDHDSAMAFRPEKIPAIMALAVGVSVLMIDKPWTQPMQIHNIDYSPGGGKYVNLGDD